VLSFSEPSGFRPNTSAVPVLPLTSTGNPAKVRAPVPLTTTSRSDSFRNFIVLVSAAIVPVLTGSIVFITVPSVLTIA
jgi:hypothetical protein